MESGSTGLDYRCVQNGSTTLGWVACETLPDDGERGARLEIASCLMRPIISRNEFFSDPVGRTSLQ
jgi:hypothetical protein